MIVCIEDDQLVFMGHAIFVIVQSLKFFGLFRPPPDWRFAFFPDSKRLIISYMVVRFSPSLIKWSIVNNSELLSQKFIFFRAKNITEF